MHTLYVNEIPNFTTKSSKVTGAKTTFITGDTFFRFHPTSNLSHKKNLETNNPLDKSMSTVELYYTI